MSDEFNQIVEGLKPSSKRIATAEVRAERKSKRRQMRREFVCPFTWPFGHHLHVVEERDERGTRFKHTECIWCLYRDGNRVIDWEGLRNLFFVVVFVAFVVSMIWLITS